jgi:hypothetical protein
MSLVTYILKWAIFIYRHWLRLRDDATGQTCGAASPAFAR